jgi:DNA-binding Lrp family transcriptional regulator
MVTAIVLIKAARPTINDLSQKLLEIKGVTEVYSVAGAWDLVAILRAKDTEQLADIATSRMVKLEGILDTQTLVAFRAYSQHDLAEIFDIGAD